MLRLITIILAISLSADMFCQAEQLAEELAGQVQDIDNATDIELLAEQLNALVTDPLDLNNCSEEQLNQSGLFTAFQSYSIIKWRKQYGPFFSIYELAAIPGLKTEKLIKIAPLLKLTSPASISQANFKRKGMLLSGISLRLPLSAANVADENGHQLYTGNPMKTVHRIQYSPGKNWSSAFALEKDPGERWNTKGRIEHFSGYVRYKPMGRLQDLIIGNFRIHTGMGLVNGLGFNTRGSGISLNAYNNSFAKGFGSTMEYAYYRGLYSKFNYQSWTATVFVSFKPEDLSLHLPEENPDLNKQIRESGLHRTENEIQGVRLANKWTSGLSVNYIKEHWNAGLSFCASEVQLSSRGKDSLSHMPEIRSRQLNSSVYVLGFGRNYEYFAEFAVNNDLRTALIAGFNLELMPVFSIYASLRRFESAYTGQEASAYAGSSRMENEAGFNTGCKITPFNKAGLFFDYDIFRPISSSEYASPYSYTSRAALRFTYTFQGGFALEARFTSYTNNKLSHTVLPGPDIPYGYKKHNFKLRYSYDLSSRIKVKGSLEELTLKADQQFDHGKLMYQQISIFLSEKSKLSYRFLLFDSEKWDTRIYCYEPGVRYSFSFPAFYGKGTRNLLLLSSKINRRLTFRSKLAWTQYAYKRETGSAADTRTRDQTWDIEFQLQIGL